MYSFSTEESNSPCAGSELWGSLSAGSVTQVTAQMVPEAEAQAAMEVVEQATLAKQLLAIVEAVQAVASQVAAGQPGLFS